MLTVEQTTFLDSITPGLEALWTDGKLPLPPQSVACQIVLETGWGTSYAYRFMHNPAGIAEGKGALRSYASLADGLAAVAQVWRQPNMDAATSYAQDHPTDIPGILRAMGDTPWDAGHYRGDGEWDYPGGVLVALWVYNLASYDWPGPTPPEAPSVSDPPAAPPLATLAGYPVSRLEAVADGIVDPVDSLVYVAARINGHDVMALVDSGSTALGIPQGLAGTLGIAPPSGTETVDTAAGSSTDQVSQADLTLGSAAYPGIPAVILRDQGPVLLGRDWIAKAGLSEAIIDTGQQDPESGARKALLVLFSVL